MTVDTQTPAVSTDVATRGGDALSLHAAMDYARALAQSQMLPAQYRKQPANVLWAIEFGRTLGLTTMAAITGVHVIEGKPSASAGLISGLVRRAGHRLRVVGDATTATCTIIRADDPQHPFVVTWTLDDARRAGLLTKNVWKQYPASMLKSRAITQCARDACEEILFGLHYTPEELGVEVGDEDGVPVVAAAAAEPERVSIGGATFRAVDNDDVEDVEFRDVDENGIAIQGGQAQGPQDWPVVTQPGAGTPENPEVAPGLTASRLALVVRAILCETNADTLRGTWQSARASGWLDVATEQCLTDAELAVLAGDGLTLGSLILAEKKHLDESETIRTAVAAAARAGDPAAPGDVVPPAGRVPWGNTDGRPGAQQVPLPGTPPLPAA